MARVAVLMPVYNTPALLLDRSIRSLFNQSFDLTQSHNQSSTHSIIRSIDIFCINDGSNQNTRELLDQYQKTQHGQQGNQLINPSENETQSSQLIRFHVIHLSTNMGIARALNAGLDEIVRFEQDSVAFNEVASIVLDPSAGSSDSQPNNQSTNQTINTFDHIVRMDSDDYCESNRIAEQVSFMNNDPTIAVCGSNVKMITLADAMASTNDEQSANQHSKQSNRVIKLPQSSIMIAWSAYFYCPIAHPSVCFRGSMIRNQSEDVDETHTISSNRSNNQTIKQSFIHYPESFSHCEDYALWLSLIEREFKFANIDLPLVTVTQPTRSNNQSNNQSINQTNNDSNMPSDAAAGDQSVKQSNNSTTDYITRTNRNLQKDESLRVVHRSINRSINQSITLNDVQSLIRPSELRDLTSAARAISLLLQLEKHVMSKSYDSAINQTNAIRDDCTARIGEILALSANLPLVNDNHSNDQSISQSVNQSASQSSVSLSWNQLFQAWLRRAPQPTQMMALMALAK